MGGVAYSHNYVVVEHSFQELKQVLLDQEKLEVETLSLILTNNPGLQDPHFDDYYHDK